VASGFMIHFPESVESFVGSFQAGLNQRVQVSFPSFPLIPDRTTQKQRKTICCGHSSFGKLRYTGMTRRVLDSRHRVSRQPPKRSLFKNGPDTLGLSCVTVASQWPSRTGQQNWPAQFSYPVSLHRALRYSSSYAETGSVVGGDERPEIFASALERPRLARVVIFRGSVSTSWGKLAPMLPDTRMDSFSGSNHLKGNPRRNSFSNLQAMYINKLMNERAKSVPAEFLPMNGGCDDK